RKDLLDLVKDLEAKKDVSGRTAELANTNEVGHLMRAFKPKNQGGIGVGKDGIGIERKLAQLSIRLLSDRALKQGKADIVMVARLSEAVAVVVSHFARGRPMTGRKANAWKHYAEDVKKAARALDDAASKADAAKVKSAALLLYNSCENCHIDFQKGPVPRRP